MRPPETQEWFTLKPFDRNEAITVKEAAAVAGKSPGTIREWCKSYGVGRRVGDGTWWVSRVALAMFLDGDKAALNSYLAGDRVGERVVSYFDRFDIRPQHAQPRQSCEFPRLSRGNQP
ncbi:hypothetical protein QCM77_18940 [Bradyrhizobium sp. SSUT18]|uniref:hypothetical protein n=1 Tax=Bradyrhizobium sp. SSUT18 TaxID=3040602 RepID=UPI00244A301E|nr:hypothetical protein [Bradyrhizobium sp. SSUT18]MDH2402019.1 hypothetical protein [Bradyrhizobium sp. SSUT18]